MFKNLVSSTSSPIPHSHISYSPSQILIIQPHIIMKYLLFSLTLMIGLTTQLFANAPTSPKQDHNPTVADHCFSIEVCSNTECYYIEVCVRTNLKAIWPDVPSYRGSVSKNKSLLSLKGLPEKMNGQSIRIPSNTHLKAIKGNKSDLSGTMVRAGTYRVSNGAVSLKLGEGK